MRRLRTAALPLGLAVLTLLFAAGVLLISRHVVDLEARHEVDLLAVESATTVSSAIEDRLSQVAAAAASSSGAVEAVDDPSAVSASDRVLARDSGQPVLDDASAGLVVVARYDIAPAPTTVQGRREAAAGYLVAPLELGATLNELAPSGFQLVVDGPLERVAVSATEIPGPGVSGSAPLEAGLAPGWSVTATGPSANPPAIAWLLALMVLLGGSGVAAAIAVRQRASRVRQAELTGLQRTNATVARLAVLAQQTRDLGELLPAMATDLTSILDLRGLTVTTATPLGDRPLFSSGSVPEPGPTSHGLHDVAAGGSVWMRLSRGGRTAARLGVVAGRDLDRYDVSTLAAVADLLASALTNAEAFAQQSTLVERMRAVDDLKSVFLATASHELRTPVVAIAGYSNFLNDNWAHLSTEKAYDLVVRVDRNAQRLSQMVEDLLDFSRLERGNALAEEQSALDLGDIVGQVLRDQPDLIQHHDVTWDLASDLIVWGSRQALERVVTNLVGNATKYTPSGTPIRVLVRVREACAEIVVEDDGPGIAEADRERVFSRFYRGEGDEVTRTRGTGLGLAIVTEFAATMGGAVRLEESESGGARFVVAFPFEHGSDPTAPPTREHTTGAPESGESS